MDNVRKNVKKFILELLFPSFCLGCQKEGSYLCYDCKSTLEISEYNYCLCNKNPIRLPANSKKGDCSRCAYKKLSGLFFALPYREKSLTRRLIHQFKYQPYIKDLSKTLADIVIEHLFLAGNNSETIWENSVLIPIPLEKGRLKSRGYNQSEELAKDFSEILHVPFISDSLIKIKKTLPQMKLSAEEREENIKNAFIVQNRAEIIGKKIFLIDDVYTTGSTMEECATQLLISGAKSVWGIVVAREG